MKFKFFFPVLAAVVALTGCGGYSSVKETVDTQHTGVTKQIDSMQQNVGKKQESALIRHVNLAWVSSRSVTREAGSSMPPQFEDITLNFGGRHNIASVAEIIQRATGIRIMIHPDVQVSMRQLATLVGGSTTQNALPATALVGNSPTSITQMGMQPQMIPGQQLLPGQMMPSVPGQPATVTRADTSDYFVDVPVTYRGSLSGFLDRVTSRLGLDWEYRDGKIEIRRFVTRTFSIIALPGKTDFKSSLGKSGGIQAGSSSTSSSTGSGSTTGSFAAQMEVASTSTVDYWVSLEGTIRAMLSNMGRVAINQGTGTVTVTDIRDVSDRIARFIEEENRTLTRQISFDVQVYAVRGSNGSEFGVDWNLVYQKLSQLAPQWGLSLVSPASLVGSSVASAGVQILKTASDDNGTLDRMTGSQAYLKALASVSKVAHVTSQRAITLNRQVVPVAVTDQTTYLAETTPGLTSTTGAAGGTSTSIGLKPGIVTTGFMMNLMPTVTERNSMVLTVTLDMSELRRITSFSVGSGASQQSIQLPEVSSTQFIQRVGLRTGETLVITGFEKISNNYDERTLDKGVAPGLGGSFKGSGNKESLVILITPVMTEGI